MPSCFWGSLSLMREMRAGFREPPSSVREKAFLLTLWTPKPNGVSSSCPQEAPIGGVLRLCLAGPLVTRGHSSWWRQGQVPASSRSALPPTPPRRLLSVGPSHVRSEQSWEILSE